jgi:hypothetical protein
MEVHEQWKGEGIVAATKTATSKYIGHTKSGEAFIITIIINVTFSFLFVQNHFTLFALCQVPCTIASTSILILICI